MATSGTYNLSNPDECPETIKNEKGHTLTKHICKHCHNAFYAIRRLQLNKISNKFCSQACVAKGRPSRKKADVNLICLHCKQEFPIKYTWRNRQKFCSNACVGLYNGEHRLGANNPAWKGGKAKRSNEEVRLIRRLKKEKGKCEECGETKNLHGHHILHHAEHPELREDPSNIQILCENCHADKHKPHMANVIKMSQRLISGVTLDCVECGKGYYVPQCRKEKSKTCSKVCQLEYIKKIRLLEIVKTGTIKKCEICDVEYYVTKSKAHKSVTCSKACQLKYVWMLRKARMVK